MKSRFPLPWYNLVFGGIVAAELVSEWTGDRTLHFITKPAIMLALIAFALITFILSETRLKPHCARNLLLAGMFCGLAGDVLLMFTSSILWAVQAGLGSFLVGHLFYIAAYRKGVKAAWNLAWWYIAAAGLYAALLLVVLFPFVGEMLLPLLVYAAALLGMMLLALERRGRVSVRSFRLVAGGALCFVVSDSILAFNLFVKQQPALGVALMALYAAAQYGICMGMLEQILAEIREK